MIHRSSLRIRSIPSRRSSTSALQSESGADGEETDEVIALRIVVAPEAGVTEAGATEADGLLIALVAVVGGAEE